MANDASLLTSIRAIGKPVPTVRGFALNPTVRGAKIASMSAYNAQQLSKGLTDPCPKTCQQIMMTYFHEGEEKCLFMLDCMDKLENGTTLLRKVE